MKALLALLFFCAGAAQAAPNDFFADLFVPGERDNTRARAEGRVYGTRHAAGHEFGLTQYRADVNVPVARGEKEAWRAQAFLDHDSLTGGPIFPNGRSLPGSLWNPGLGVGYTRQLEEKRALAGAFTVSSPSDRPYDRWRDLGLNLSFTYKIPDGEENAWILFLGVSNMRNFLNYLPLPGAGYLFRAHPRLRMIVGFPFMMMYWLPADHVTVSAHYFPIRNGELKLSVGSPRGWQPYALVRYHTSTYALSSRPEGSRERLFYDEGAAQAGVSAPITAGLFLDLGGGVSFTRRYYLAERSSERATAPGIPADNAPYAAAKLSGTF